MFVCKCVWSGSVCVCSLVNEMKSNPIPHPSTVFQFSFLLYFSPHSSFLPFLPHYISFSTRSSILLPSFIFPSIFLSLIIYPSPLIHLSFHFSFIIYGLLPSFIYPFISPSLYILLNSFNYPSPVILILSFLPPSILLPLCIYPFISPPFYPSPLVHLSFSPHLSILPFLPSSILLPLFIYPSISPPFYPSPLIHLSFHSLPTPHPPMVGGQTWYFLVLLLRPQSMRPSPPYFNNPY